MEVTDDLDEHVLCSYINILAYPVESPRTLVLSCQLVLVIDQALSKPTFFDTVR